MAFYYKEPSHTFSEYLLVPGYSSSECQPKNVSLKTPLVKFKKGEEPSISLNIPLVSAIMQAVSNDTLALALAKEGGISFIYGSQSIEDQAAMVKRVKSYKAGFVKSDSNLTPDNTLADVIKLKESTGHSTIAITDDGTGNGKLLGVVTSRDYRVSRMSLDLKVREFMTPLQKLVTAKSGITLREANDIIWDHKLNSLPIVDEQGRLDSFVFRKDYESKKSNPNELLDEQKRFMVGAGINTRDYKERVPALVEAGVDVLCIDSSEGFSEWQKLTIAWIRENYGDTVKVGAGNVVDEDGFRFLAECGADFVKVGIGGGSICITRETKGIGRGQATATIEVAKARDEYYEEPRRQRPRRDDGEYYINPRDEYEEDFIVPSHNRRRAPQRDAESYEELKRRIERNYELEQQSKKRGRFRRSKKSKYDYDDYDELENIQEMHRYPVEEESEKLLKMENILHNRIVGQNEAVDAVARAIRRKRAAR